jgi:hypothetical protein
MAADTALSRVRKTEFFAILAPGIYVVSAASLLVLAVFGPKDNLSPWERIYQILSDLSKDWFVAGAGLFFAYLIGSVLRAIPVRVADEFCGRLFKITAKGPFEDQIYSSKFPYSNMLGKQLEALHNNGVAKSFKPPLKDGSTHTMFNYWKAILCHHSPDSFAYGQELEGQVRLFAGMFWAGVIGFLISAIGLFLCRRSISTDWFTPLILSGSLSLVIGGVFGWRLRRVRADEVVRVFLAFIASVHKPILPSHEGTGYKKDEHSE